MSIEIELANALAAEVKEIEADKQHYLDLLAAVDARLSAAQTKHKVLLSEALVRVGTVTKDSVVDVTYDKGVVTEITVDSKPLLSK